MSMTLSPRVTLAAASAFLALAAAAPTVAVAGGGSQWSIVATYPVPEGASGLAYDGTWLYCGIYGPGGNEVYRIDPATGGYTLLFVGPQEDAFGLTHDGQHLWTTDHPGSSSTPAVALKLDMDGSVIEQIELPTHYMSGIAYDDGDFWVTRYYPDPGHVYKLDAAGTILAEFDFADDQPWDLCVQDGAMWIADYWGDTLYKIDPATGEVLDSHPSEGVDPAGIVWDGQHLWYCDNGEGGVDFLYKVDLSGGGTPGIEVPIESHDYGIVAIGDFASWTLTIENSGNAPLAIDSVTFGTTDLSTPTGASLEIAPGQSAQLSIDYAPGAFGPLGASATLASNDPVHPEVTLALSGHGVYPDATIDVPDTAHDYGAVRTGAHTRWFMAIGNQGLEVLTVDEIAIDDGHFYLDGSVELPIVLEVLATVQVGLWYSPDSSAAHQGTATVTSNDREGSPMPIALSGSGDNSERPIGEVLWSYTIDTDFDNSPKAIAPLPDISGDGVAEVIVCSEDDFIRCFNGNAHGTGDVLWEHEIFAGSVYGQNGLQIVQDLDTDGSADVIVGSAWGGRLIRALSGKSGTEIWTHDTDNYGDGGWVYQVDATQDYNDDGVVDVLASTGDDSSDTGPKRVYCLNGLTGAPIWERPLGGPVFAVIGVADFTGDGVADAVAGASNGSETQGFAYGIDGADGTLEWTFPADGSSVWALGECGDVSNDGVGDIIIGDFFGTVYGIDAVTGTELYSSDFLGITTRFQRLDDVDADGFPEFVPSHFADFTHAIGGGSGAATWTTPVADSSATAARIADISGDGVNDVVVGTLFSDNYVYFLDGVTGAVLDSSNYGTPVDAIGSIPDVVGDGSWEMVAGGRNGLVTCVSGGTAVSFDPADINMDGSVDVQDLILLISAWGPNPGNPADVNDDGVVDVTDLIALIQAWGT